ncbi:hypothetical protein [Changchengzhania lutea]|nr:hypothetical protein [Changchengzhania lutea]
MSLLQTWYGLSDYEVEDRVKVKAHHLIPKYIFDLLMKFIH